MNKNDDILKKLYLIVASKNTEENEYKEITDSIRLVIHECIDRVNEEANKIVDETVKDIKNRLSLESDGHKLDKDKLNKMIIELSNNIFDIYADENNKPISADDYWKYSTSFLIKNKLENNKLENNISESETGE